MKKMYRIELRDGANSLCESLAVLAAKSNGGKWLSIEELIMVAKVDIIKYPISNEDITVSKIDENSMVIDRKLGKEYQTVLAINLVEIQDLKTIEEITEEALMDELNNPVLLRNLSQTGSQC